MIESTLHVLHRSEEMENEKEAKLEAIFTYLFNIQEQGYQLHEAEMFDDEERELLATHKERFMGSIQLVKENAVVMPLGTHQENEVDFGESVLDIFSPPQATPTPQTSSAPSTNLKLMEHELERASLTGKISELKERHLHLREVILQFLKSLDLRYLSFYFRGVKK